MDKISLGNIIILSSPSGGGKTTLLKSIVRLINNISAPISYTTRPIRPGEKEGIDYFFIKEKQFFIMKKKKFFLEYARIFNYYYGISFEEINKFINNGIDLILAINWQGVKRIKYLYPNQTISIFIIPPSLRVLKHRLFNRNKDYNFVNERMRYVKNDVIHLKEFDYLIINDDLDHTILELYAIILANRLKMRYQKINNKDLLSSFLLSL
ncbi:guanylate kinase [Candidatus Legionella polyplacis]|uniref:Guanylate kinase n=1 Tax=Candidatus Legionella polyplacis TaxID=2005262 RepID=A0ABZ2GY06_9GAMM